MKLLRPLAGALGITVVVAGCGILPAAPSPAPTDFVPTASASPGAMAGALSPDGFTAAQRMAVRVRNIGCGFLATGSGFALDKHTLVTNRHVVENAKNIEVSTYDGRVIQATAASATTVADIAIGLSIHRWISTPISRPTYVNVDRYYARLLERSGFRRYGRDGGP